MRQFSNGGLRPALAGSFIALSVLASALPARADTWKGLELRRKLDDAAWKWGPFRVQPSLVIANAGIDSNVLYSPTDPIKDFTITAGPAATLYIPFGRRFVLSASGSPQYVWYSKTDRERTWNYYASAAAQLNLKNVFFSLDGTYSDARERWNTEIDLRPRRKQLGYGASMLVKVAWKTSFSLGYRTAKYDYESVVTEGGFNVQERLNRRESYGNLSLFYQVSTLNRFFIDLEYGSYDFQFAEQAALSNSQSEAAYAGFEFSPLGRRLRGRVRIGYKKFDLRNPSLPDYQGLVGDTQISLRLNAPLAIRASYVRDVVFSLWYNNPYFIQSQPGVGASLYVFRFLRFDYDYSFGRNRYSLAGGGGPDVKRLDDYIVHSAGVYFRIAKKTALGFIASWWARNSNLPSEDDKRTFFGLNLTYDF
jgi:hypothetical protein